MRRKPVNKRPPLNNRRSRGPVRRPRKPIQRPRRPVTRDDSPPINPSAGLRAYVLHLIEVADTLPWFGEEPFKPSEGRQPPRPVFASLGYQRRILLAFLAGRPISHVAARAGCGTRIVYTVIGGVVYNLPEYDEIPIWLDLGLFGVVAPRPDQPPPPLVEVGLMKQSVGKNDVLLFCLLCHGFMGGLDNAGFAWRPDPDFGVLLLGPSVIRDRGVTDKMQGHLVAHFMLQEERIAVPVLDVWAINRAIWARRFEDWDDPDLIRLNRRNNWSRRWSLGEAANRVLDHRRPLGGAGFLPSVGGRHMNIERAREHWLSLIPNPGRIA